MMRCPYTRDMHPAAAWLTCATVACAVAGAGVLAASSLTWRLTHDAAIMMYQGFLIADHGMMPYRDFFDMNAPGAILPQALFHSLVQFSDLRFRLLDLSLLLAIVALTIHGTRTQEQRRAAIFSSALFVIGNLVLGQMNSFQRELLLVLPLAASLLLTFRAPRISPQARAFLIGCAAGVIALIKPQHALVTTPLLVALMRRQAGETRNTTAFPMFLRLAGTWMAGYAIVLAAVVSFLACNDAWRPFTDIASNYWPLYSMISGDGYTSPSTGEAIARIIQHHNLLWPVEGWPFTALVVIGFLMVTASGRHSTMRREAMTIHAMCAYVMLVNLLAGKAWIYHAIPLHYLMALIAGHALLHPPHVTNRRMQAALAGIVLLALLIDIPIRHTYHEARAVLAGSRPVTPDVQEVARYLTAQPPAERSVLVLDVTSGALEAMYRTGSTPGTRFIYSFHFHHHCSTPYITRLRRTLEHDITHRRPARAIWFKHPWRPVGPGACETYVELDRLLETQYRIDVDTPSYTIFRRRDLRPHPRPIPPPVVRLLRTTARVASCSLPPRCADTPPR